MTKNYAVLGSPIAHSKSPTIHNAAFNYLGVDASYTAVEISDDLAKWVSSLDESWRGLSVTMPLKTQALDLGERADSLAIAANSANTLVRTESGWDAYNTDIFGIQMALSGVQYRRVAVLGTGATARSAVVAMLESGKEVGVWGRNPEATKQLALEFDVAVLKEIANTQKYDVVISTLPAHALDGQLGDLGYLPNNVLLDVAYNPWPSAAAVLWSGSGLAISGLEMLIWQAVAQQRLFAGNDLNEALKDEKELVAVIREALSMAK